MGYEHRASEPVAGGGDREHVGGNVGAAVQASIPVGHAGQSEGVEQDVAVCHEEESIGCGPDAIWSWVHGGLSGVASPEDICG